MTESEYTVTYQDLAPAIAAAATHSTEHIVGGLIIATGLAEVRNLAAPGEDRYEMDLDEADLLAQKLPEDTPFYGMWYTKAGELDDEDKENAAYVCGQEEEALGAATLMVITPALVYMLNESGEPFFTCPHKST